MFSANPKLASIVWKHFEAEPFVLFIALCLPSTCITNILDWLKPEHDGQQFVDNIFKCILFKEKFSISNKISFKFIPKGSINNKSTLIEVKAWCRKGNKPLHEPMMTQHADTSYASPVPPLPLTIFWSNLKLDQNLECSRLKCTVPITTKCRDMWKISLWSVKYILQ